MESTEQDLIDYLAHFPEGISDEIKKYATEEVFKHSRYIFTRRQGKQQYSWCTHCSSEFKTSGFTHNKEVVCPGCGSRCTVKASGIGRKRMIDEAYFVYYEKSLKDPKIIVARGIYAVRDYSDDYHFVQTLYLERARYIFEMDKSMMIERYGYYSLAKTMQLGTFASCKSVYSLSGQYLSNAKITLKYSVESIKEAVRDTAFSWSGWESYDHQDMAKFFDLYSRYPSIEYLTKLGFKDLVNEKLRGHRTYSAINWRGKTLFKVLRLTKQEFKEIRSQNIRLDFWYLHLLKMNKVRGWNLSLLELSRMADIYEIDHYIQDLQDKLRFGSMREILNYLSKQYQKDPKNYYSESSVLGTWKDYINDCIGLEMDLTDEKVLFPRNLYNAHQNTIKQVKYNVDKALNVKIKSRLKALESYRFEYSGLLIRAAENTQELIDEGKALNHCVGGYAARYADGKLDILFIRKISEADKPYFTVEIRDKKILQVRGKNNCLYKPGDDVDEFIKAFKDQRLNTRKVKERIQVAVPA